MCLRRQEPRCTLLHSFQNGSTTIRTYRVDLSSRHATWLGQVGAGGNARRSVTEWPTVQNSNDDWGQDGGSSASAMVGLPLGSKFCPTERAPPLFAVLLASWAGCVTGFRIRTKKWEKGTLTPTRPARPFSMDLNGAKVVLPSGNTEDLSLCNSTSTLV